MYRIILITIAMLTTVLGVFANAAAPDHGRTLIVRLKGRAIGETRTIPPLRQPGQPVKAIALM